MIDHNILERVVTHREEIKEDADAGDETAQEVIFWFNNAMADLRDPGPLSLLEAFFKDWHANRCQTKTTKTQ